MKQLIEDNYESTVKRGLITEDTTMQEFINKINEELHETQLALKQNIECLSFELADIILVCLNFAKHYDIDIEYYLKEKVKINFDRI